MVCTDDAIMSAEYRNYGNANNEDFCYFVTRILSAISPANNNFKQRKDKDLISDTFSVIDKAFGLMIIYNEHDVWKNQRERKLDGTVDQKRKQFCDARSGSRHGWMEEGQELFNDLCLENDRLQHQPETRKEF
eukprot:4329415-Ditylum_brightwellii.AAC.1